MRQSRSLYSESSAQDLAFTVLRRLRQIRDFPRSGRVVPELQVECLREMLAQGYRILYEVFPDRVEIFGIISSRQDVMPPR
jgi:plasmid stabilization system protein ParE